MTMLSDHGVGGVTDNYGIYLANTLYRNRRLNALASSVQSYSKLYMQQQVKSRKFIWQFDFVDSNHRY